MDELNLELELLRQLDEQEQTERQEPKEASVSPYKSVGQERLGVFANMMQELDQVLEAVFGDEDDKETP